MKTKTFTFDITVNGNTFIDNRLHTNFPSPDNPIYLIESIVITDLSDYSTTYFTTHKLNQENIDVINKNVYRKWFDIMVGTDPDLKKISFFQCDSEEDILNHLFLYKDAIFAGWNTIDFDMKYLRNRAEKLGVNLKTTSMFFDYMVTYKGDGMKSLAFPNVLKEKTGIDSKFLETQLVGSNMEKVISADITSNILQTILFKNK